MIYYRGWVPWPLVCPGESSSRETPPPAGRQPEGRLCLDGPSSHDPLIIRKIVNFNGLAVLPMAMASCDSKAILQKKDMYAFNFYGESLVAVAGWVPGESSSRAPSPSPGWKPEGRLCFDGPNPPTRLGTTNSDNYIFQKACRTTARDGCPGF